MNREKKKVFPPKGGGGTEGFGTIFLERIKNNWKYISNRFLQKEAILLPMVNDECHLWCFVWLFWGKKTNNVDNQGDNFYHSKKWQNPG